MIASNPSNEIKITRIYNAPVKTVWSAWSDPVQVAQWWGPRGFTLTTHSKDLRPGGTWEYTMHGPDGEDYPNRTYYHEVEEEALLVYDHGASADRPPLFRVTVRFTDLYERTRMDMTMALPTPEAAAETKKFIKKAGGEATWDRLAEFLEECATGRETFVINRSFEAPVAAVYAAWTDPKLLAAWLAPAGFTMKFMRADIRAGGSSFYSMSNGGGVTMYGRAEYLELQRPDRIVYTQQFCEADEKVSRHPLANSWPETMLTTVAFVPEGAGQTGVTVTWNVHGKAAAEELATFAGAKGGMTQGWTGSFDKLEALLSAEASK